MSSRRVKVKSFSIPKMESCCTEVCTILKALSHPQRLLILGHLVNSSKTVSELVQLTSSSQSQLSQFLIRMKTEGLVISERQGKFQIYSIKDSRLKNLLLTIQKEYG